jgi:hypothetical protein
MYFAPIARIVVRYGVGAAVGIATADAVQNDPDLMNMLTVGVGTVLSYGTEYLYTQAVKRGWAT